MKTAFTGCLLSLSLAAGAQPTTIAPPAPPAPPVPLIGLADLAGHDMTMFVSSEMGGRGVVKSAPYSATAVNETRQTLGDGNRIDRSSSVKLYRDSKGRTRQEQASGIVFINDVVAGKRYVLNTQKKTARELRAVPLPPVPPVPPAASVPMPAPPVQPHQLSGDEARSWAKEMRQWAREFGDRIRGERHAAAAQTHQHVTQHVEVIRFDDGRSSMPPMPMVMMAPPGQGTKTSLGSRDFDGVRAEGNKTTWTIPAGRVGNKLPIEIISERWYSPDLMLVISSTHSDPRSGERIYRLESIRRDEPSAELFKVPADYELKALSRAKSEHN